MTTTTSSWDINAFDEKRACVHALFFLLAHWLFRCQRINSNAVFFEPFLPLACWLVLRAHAIAGAYRLISALSDGVLLAKYLA